MRCTIKKQSGGEIIASGISDATVQEFEGNWYFKPEVVNMHYFRVTDRTYTCPYKGIAFWIDLEAPGARMRSIGWVYQNPKPGYEFIKDQIGFYRRNTAATIAIQESD